MPITSPAEWADHSRRSRDLSDRDEATVQHTTCALSDLPWWRIRRITRVMSRSLLVLAVLAATGADLEAQPGGPKRATPWVGVALGGGPSVTRGGFGNGGASARLALGVWRGNVGAVVGVEGVGMHRSTTSICDVACPRYLPDVSIVSAELIGRSHHIGRWEGVAGAGVGSAGLAQRTGRQAIPVAHVGATYRLTRRSGLATIVRLARVRLADGAAALYAPVTFGVRFSLGALQPQTP